MSTGSQAAVTSPLMSTTAVVSPTRRTSIVSAGALILGSSPWCGRPPGSGRGRGELADGAVEIREELDEVRQPGDVEDLAVVRGQPARDDLPAFGARPGEDADDERDARGVDVVHRGEVEHDGAGAGALG